VGGEKLTKAASVFRNEDAIDDMQNAVRGHDVACNHLFAVNVEFALQVTFQQQGRAEERSRTGPPLDDS
jgi:hypothetical protein